VYDWSSVALVGVLVVTASLLLDIYARRNAQGSARPRVGPASPTA
jgi:hypothetical protein